MLKGEKRYEDGRRGDHSKSASREMNGKFPFRFVRQLPDFGSARSLPARVRASSRRFRRRAISIICEY